MRFPNLTAEDVERRHAALPEDALLTYESAETSRALFEIGKRHGLAIDKIGALAEALGYLILGVLPAAEFTTAIGEIAGDTTKGNAIATEINQKILAPIREYLMSGSGGEIKLAPGKQPLSASVPPQKTATPSPTPSATVSRPTPPRPIADIPSQPRKPEPLIIRPLGRAPTAAEIAAAQRGEGTRNQALGTRPSGQALGTQKQGLGTRDQGLGVNGQKPMPQAPTQKPVPSAPAPTASTAPILKPPMTPSAQGAAVESVKRIADSGKPPLPASEPSPDYLKAKGEMEKELGEWREKQGSVISGQGLVMRDQKSTLPPAPPKPVTPPSALPVLTKAVLENEMERVKRVQGPGDQGSVVSGQVGATPTAPVPQQTPAQPPPINPAPSTTPLRPQTTTPPKAPESPFQSDPYREPVE